MRYLIFGNLRPFPETSFLILRFFTGITMCYYHGWSKLFSSIERLEKLGSNFTQWLGLDSLSVPFGIIAAFSESIGALMVALGFFTRPSAFLLAFTMMVATVKNITDVGMEKTELSLIFLILSCVIFISGPGRYSIDKLFSK